MIFLKFTFELFFQRSAIFIGIIALIVWIFQSGSGKNTGERFTTSIKAGALIFVAILVFGFLAKGCEKIDMSSDCEDYCDCHKCT